MNPQESKQFLQALGIGGAILTAAFITAAGFYVYNQYLNIEQTKLNVERLKYGKANGWKYEMA